MAIDVTNSDVARLFLDTSHAKLVDEYWPRLRACVESLRDDEIWWRPNERSNSVGNLALHLNGNLHQWLVASFGGLDDKRDRGAEFAQRETMDSRLLLDRLGATVQEASDTLKRLTDADLTRTMQIQGYTVSGLYAVYHVVEHFSMHQGQIAYITKLLRAEDLGFYRELDATGRRPQQ